MRQRYGFECLGTQSQLSYGTKQPVLKTPAHSIQARYVPIRFTCKEIDLREGIHFRVLANHGTD
jgi:hypothetical protein